LPLHDLVIEDALLTIAPSYQSGDVNNDQVLDLTETWIFTGSYTLTQADIDAGFIDNQAEITTKDPNGNPVLDLSDDPQNPANADPNHDGNPDDVTHTLIPQHPELSLEKTGIFTDENGDGLAQIGETIVYSFKVINTGNVTISDIRIDDPLVSVLGGPIVLLPGDSDSTTFTAVYTITSSDLEEGQVENQATAIGNDPSNTEVRDLSDDPSTSTPEDPTIVPVLGLEISTIFTPNGDGVNDTWVISGITHFPNNTVRVYNRWGNLVYDAKGYINNWDGHSNGRITVNQSNLLPVGTYFYVIDLGDGEHTFTGYLYLNR